MPIIDVHTHLGQFHHAGFSADGQKLCKMLRLGGITHAISFSAEACYGGIELGNHYTISEVERQSMLAALIVVHPHHYENSVRLINEFSNHPKVVGIKIHPHLGQYDVLDRHLSELIEKEIAPLQLPILSHVANDAPNVTCDRYFRLAARFPTLRFVAAHMGVGMLGSGDVSTEAWMDQQPQNVWFDLGTMRFFYSGAFDNLLNVVGPEKLCFGTDAPLYWPPAFTRTLETLGLDKSSFERIAWRNALDVFPKLREVFPKANFNDGPNI